MGERKKVVLIIGAGPAGLTAAYEILKRTDMHPVVIERSEYMGGISRTVSYKGNKIDIGGHRFFSKSDRVMHWWLSILPLQANDAASCQITYQNQKRDIPQTNVVVNSDNLDDVMLVRKRKSRIYFTRTFFDYPLKVTPDTLQKLGLWRAIRIGISYGKSLLFPLKPEKNLEQFFINRFGRELYLTFFKAYTEKVWGVACDQISAEWGAQRIKGLSITKAIVHFVRHMFKKQSHDVAQKNVETTLIEQFLYPKFGPGHLWQVVADKIKNLGGEIITHTDVDQLYADIDNTITRVGVCDKQGKRTFYDVDYVFSTTSIKELFMSFQFPVDENVKNISQTLQYRDFITVGLLVDKLLVQEISGDLIQDNWIYIQEPDVLVGRLQIFNNWSPFMVADPTKVWIGLEYFCYTTDALWNMSDDALIILGKQELEKIGIIDAKHVLDGTVIRMEKTYPAYFGAYAHFDTIKSYVNQFGNLFLLGRNGQHKYNNQDHSMLTAMQAVDALVSGNLDKEPVWSVNTEKEYHEEKSS